MFLLFWIPLYGSLVDLTGGQSYENITNLRTTLLTSYNPDVLPLNDQSNVLNINLTMAIFKIPEVDPVRGALTMAVMVTQQWYDERLTWSPDDHGGITSISIKSTDVWTPLLAVANPVKFTLLGQPWMPVTIMADGQASYTVAEIVEFSCVFYMKFWPFDKHVCSIGFFPYGHPSTSVALSALGSVVSLDFYEKNGEWNLDKTSFKYKTDTTFGISRATYTFRIARQPLFYMVTVIIPINGIGALICLVFLLPSVSGERVGYSVTIVLSLAVFLSVIAADLPKNSEPFPVTCIYILFSMLVCICGVILVIFNLALFHRSENVPISKIYKYLVRLSMSACSPKKVPNRIHTEKNNFDSKNQSKSASMEKGTIPEGNMILQDMNSEYPDEIVEVEENITWTVVSEAIDKLLFYSMFVLSYIPSVIILVYIAVQSDYVIQGTV